MNYLDSSRSWSVGAERVVVSRSGDLIAIGTDFHWQEYWYQLKSGESEMDGVMFKYLQEPFEVAGRVLRRLLTGDLRDHEYSDIIKQLIGMLQRQQPVVDPSLNGGGARIIDYNERIEKL